MASTVLLTSEVRLRPCGAENWPGEFHQLKNWAVGKTRNRRSHWFHQGNGWTWGINSGINWGFFTNEFVGRKKWKYGGWSIKHLDWNISDGFCNDSPTIFKHQWWIECKKQQKKYRSKKHEECTMIFPWLALLQHLSSDPPSSGGTSSINMRDFPAGEVGLPQHTQA